MTDGKPMAITDTSFDSEVLNSDVPVLLDFWAAWCGPCKMIAPVVEELASDHAETLKVGKLDVDSDPGVAMRYGVQSIPTLILFKDGQEAERIIGFLPKERLLAKLAPHLS